MHSPQIRPFIRIRTPRRPLLALLIALCGTGTAAALSLPFEEHTYLPPEATTTYEERSLNHQAPLTVEHPPTSRARDRAAIAGFCADAGFVRRRDPNDPTGERILLRQREICENVAPRQLYPGIVDPRPAWPRRDLRRARALTTKG